MRVSREIFRTSSGTQSIATEGVETDAQGQFELRDVPRGGVSLTVTGETIFSAQLELGEDSVEGLSISVAARCYLQVELAETAPKNVLIEIRDEHGLALPIAELGSANMMTRKPLAPGASVVLQTSEDARTLRALSGGGREYASIPVLPGSDQLTEVRLEF